jgi:hypothetical protein
MYPSQVFRQAVSIISPHSPEALALYDPPNSKVAEAILEKGSDAGAIRDPDFDAGNHVSIGL